MKQHWSLPVFLFLSTSLTLSAFGSGSAFAQSTAQAATKSDSQESIEGLLPSEVLEISDDRLITTHAFLADKTRRNLHIVQSSNSTLQPISLVYDIDIGKNDGNKTKRDDKKTPEGIYLLQEKKTPPEIPFDQYGVMAFTTNYPNVFDKFENKTGSGIWLHSIPDQVALNRGSRGCVVLRNEAIKRVEEFISLNKTPLIINSKIDWVKPDVHSAKKDTAVKWLNRWKDLWEKQELDEYIKSYSEQFSDSKFNKKTWLAHKRNLKAKYKYVKINLSKPNIFNLKDQYLFQFVQDYSSDGHTDRGIKNLYVIKTNGEFKILREEWAPVPSDPISKN